MQQQVKVGSIIEILNHDAEDISDVEAEQFPVGSRHTVVAFHPETGEVEVPWSESSDAGDAYTFFPGEYKLVE